MNTGTIYCWINKLNGMMYVGKTIVTKSRINQYKNNKHTGQIKFYNATQKYGWSNFKFEIIEDNIDLNQLNDKEKYWIKHLCTVEFGYNLTYGGDGRLGIPHTEQTKLKISKSNKGKCKSAEHKQNMSKPKSEKHKKALSEAVSGSRHHFFGKPRLFKAGKPKQSIICIQTGQVFESIKDTAKNLNLCQCNISQHINGKRKSVGGFTFKRV